MNILAIESSCDETAAAVVKDGKEILSNVVASSTLMHRKYGGIVPEVAAREQVKYIIPVITEALSPFTKPSQKPVDVIRENIDAIAITVGPGLIGSLLVGVETARTFAAICNKPIIPVNHVLAHMYANFVLSPVEGQNLSRVILRDSIIDTENHQQLGSPSTGSGNSPYPDSRGSKLEARSSTLSSPAFPAISLVVSGGHTELYLMTSPKELTWLGGTLDDAAGEAFDKSARLLGFGHGGGIAIQNAATGYKLPATGYHPFLPRPLMHDDSLNFSFSGLKTAVMRDYQKYKEKYVMLNSFQHPIQSKNSNTIEINASNQDLTLKQVQGDDILANMFAYEIQEAITDVLVAKTLKAAEMYQAKSILLSGGVAANARLREKFKTKLETRLPSEAIAKDGNSKLALLAPPPALCTDNAVYIASYAYFRGEAVDWREIEARPGLSVEL